MSDKKERIRKLELLAPARNLECGIAAIDHGADAVYIGAPRFGARAAAGNSLNDIRLLCEYAHQFGAKVHVTVNTIIYDEEMEDTLRMIVELDKIGVDALLLQDMGVLWEVRAQQLWHRELHSSTQCDCRTADKAWWRYLCMEPSASAIRVCAMPRSIALADQPIGASAHSSAA